MFKIILLVITCSTTTVFATLQDPTAPLQLRDLDSTDSKSYEATKDKEKEQSKLKLNAIITTDLEKKAIISGRVVRIGEKVPGGLVVDIKSTTVLLDLNGVIKELFLFNGNIKVEINE